LDWSSLVLLSTSDLGPIALVGRFVRLDPLRANHAAALWEVARGMDWVRCWDRCGRGRTLIDG